MLLEALGTMVVSDMPPNLSTRNEGIAHSTGVVYPHLLSLRVGQIMLFLLSFTIKLITGVTDNYIFGSNVVLILLNKLFSK